MLSRQPQIPIAQDHDKHLEVERLISFPPYDTTQGPHVKDTCQGLKAQWGKKDEKQKGGFGE